ncbi:MAG: LamG-like jellyroll fold domain-containing protein, partial [Saprospiraceae bacterium]
LRGWGTIVGKWGGLDVSGLVGEANDKGNDYAFILNGVQQAAALVPMLRYDKRFAGAIGKWVLNLSNASRLFYSNFLPASLQDGREWSEQNDPDNVIAHEAIKEQFSGKSPFATGDAIGGKWAATNYSLYSSSSIGYLGSIVSKTNVDKILRLDLNATDFFAEESYPSFLLYNPYTISQTVVVDLGSVSTDLYETLSETFEGKSVSGQISIVLAPNETKILVQTPVGGEISIDQNRLLVDNIVIDYQQTKVPNKQKPRIKAVAANRYIIEKGDTTRVYGTYVDGDSDEVMTEWSSDQDSIQGSGNEVIFRAADQEGMRKVKLKVTDESGNVDSLEIELSIVEKINKAPQILELVKSAEYVEPNGTIEVLCKAVDLDLDAINFTWTANGGNFMGLDSLVEWKAPASEGIYTINVKVTDTQGLSSSASTQILVKNFIASSGKTIASYPFSGNANDNSGNGHNGTTAGAILAPDRFDNIRNAYYFNGGSQHIRVNNDPKLNFQGACTISFWMKASNLPDRESFLVSHGSWQNRYKVSMTPSAQLRWTINTTGGIKDLDSKKAIEAEKYYHCAVTYDGKLMAIYLNGVLSNYVSQTGSIKQTTVNLLMGQMLPDDANYNFKGYLDDVTIYDHAKTPLEIEQIYHASLTAIHEIAISQTFSVTPNPAYSTISIQSIKGQIGQTSGYELTIFNQLGQTIKTAQNYQLGNPIVVSMLSDGLYYLRLQKANDIINSSFLIHKI